jgi:KRAB domain-containing zinc finger protein
VYIKVENLKMHMKTHSGDKSFVCDICGKHFTWRGSFQRHKRAHTINKPV